MGRRALLADVREHLALSRVVTLVGPGGVGKTRVALQFTEAERRSYRDGCWVASLADVTAPELLANAVAEAIGLGGADVPSRVDTLADYIAQRTALLMLDNCEHLLSGVSDLVQGLRAACPNVRFLLTSRRPMRLSGEVVILVRPLDLPDRADGATPGAITHYEAVNLFLDRAVSARSDFELSVDNAPAVVALCRELDGIPLAIELAAARIRVLSPQEIRDSLSERLKVLNIGYYDAHERHRTLSASVQWSYDLCTQPEQVFWARSSVFASGFDLTAAAAVCAFDDLAAAEILDLLSALVDQSVILAEEAVPGRTRYRMLADIRQFGLDHLEKDGELLGIRGRHARWYGELVSRFHYEVCGPHQRDWLSRLRLEQANLRAAIEYETGGADTAAAGLVLVRKLDLYWSASGFLDEARHWLELALGSGAGTPPERASAMAVAARFAALQNDRIRARELIEAGTETAASADDGRALGLLLVPAAMVSIWDGAPAAAAVQADQAVAMLRAADCLDGELLALFAAGVCYGFARNGLVSAARHQECIDRADRVGESHMKALAVAGLGEQELAAGSLDAATTRFRAAIVLKRELGDRMGIAVGLDSLGRVATAQGQGERAALLLGAAEGIWDVVGMSQTGNPFAFAPSRSEGLKQARALLGKRRFRDLFRRGSRLSLDDMVAFALEEKADAVPPSGAVQSSPLTRRELEIADLVAEGLSNPDIAARLFISVRTAQGHVENILRKLGFTSRSQIASWVTERRMSETDTVAIGSSLVSDAARQQSVLMTSAGPSTGPGASQYNGPPARAT